MPIDIIMLRVTADVHEQPDYVYSKAMENDVFSNAPEGADLRVAVPREIGGIALQPDMVVYARAHIFVASGEEARASKFQIGMRRGSNPPEPLILPKEEQKDQE